MTRLRDLDGKNTIYISWFFIIEWKILFFSLKIKSIPKKHTVVFRSHSPSLSHLMDYSLMEYSLMDSFVNSLSCSFYTFIDGLSFLNSLLDTFLQSHEYKKIVYLNFLLRKPIWGKARSMYFLSFMLLWLFIVISLIWARLGLSEGYYIVTGTLLS